jgi:hypothetical protein
LWRAEKLENCENGQGEAAIDAAWKLATERAEKTQREGKHPCICSQKYFMKSTFMTQVNRLVGAMCNGDLDVPGGTVDARKNDQEFCE